MIQHLIDAIVAQLGANLAGVTIGARPPATAPPAPLPAIVVYPGPFVINHAGRDLPAPPQIWTVQQIITLKSGVGKAGPYPLDTLALAGTLNAMLLAEESPARLLDKNKDFTVDYPQASISFTNSKIKAPGKVNLEYKAAQAMLSREFQQELWIDTYAVDPAAAEQWAALACAIVLGSADELLRGEGSSPYRAGLFTATQTLSRLQLLGGTPGPSDEAWLYQLQLSVAGQLRMSRQIYEGDGVITEVLIQQGAASQ